MKVVPSLLPPRITVQRLMSGEECWYFVPTFCCLSQNVYSLSLLSDCRVFINRKPRLRLESVRWKEDAELLVLLREEKRTSSLSTWVLPS